jgi:hypothetical protein
LRDFFGSVVAVDDDFVDAGAATSSEAFFFDFFVVFVSADVDSVDDEEAAAFSEAFFFFDFLVVFVPVESDTAVVDVSAASAFDFVFFFLCDFLVEVDWVPESLEV